MAGSPPILNQGRVYLLGTQLLKQAYWTIQGGACLYWKPGVEV